MTLKERIESTYKKYERFCSTMYAKDSNGNDIVVYGNPICVQTEEGLKDLENYFLKLEQDEKNKRG